RPKAFVELHAWLIAEPGELRNVGTAPECSAGGGGAGDEVDFTFGRARDAARKVRDRHLLHRADVINAEMLAFFAHHEDAGDQIVDEAEAAGLLAGALDPEAQRTRRVLLRPR